MKLSQVIASLVITASVLSYSLPAIAAQGVIIEADPETCVKRGGRPITDTKCRLLPTSN